MASGTLKRRGKRGIWHVIYQDPATGRQVWRTTGTTKRREAEMVLNQLRHRLGLEGDSHIPSHDTPLGEFCIDRWLPERCAVLKESTRHTYLGTTHRILTFFGSSIAVRKALTVARTQAYVAHMVGVGRSSATISAHLAVISSIATYAVAVGVLERNPVPAVKRPRAQTPTPTAYTADEVRLILSCAPPAHADLLTVLFMTGVRQSEAAELRVGDALLGGMTGHASPSLTIARRAWRGTVDTPKTGTRTIALGAIAAEAIGRAAQGKREGDLLFPGDNGGHMVWARFGRDVWLPTLRRAGVTESSLHGSRRTAVTLTLAQRVAPQVAAARFGMSVGTMLRHYAAVLDAESVAAADAIETVLVPGVLNATSRVA